MNKPTRCIDHVIKYCQGCKYGIIHYAENVETYQDTFGANFKTHCIYGLEKQQPLEDELKEFYTWYEKRRNRK